MKQRKAQSSENYQLKVIQERMEKTLIQNLLESEDTLDADAEMMARQQKLIQLQHNEDNPNSLQYLRIRSNYLTRQLQVFGPALNQFI